MRWRKRLCATAVFAAGLTIVSDVEAVECGMSRNFFQTDIDAPGGKTAVWASANGDALLFAEKLHVNTDGTLRSYSVSDFWGEREALNNLCNAMRGSCAELKGEPALRARRELTQEAFRRGWPSDLLKRSRISPNVIVFKGGKPCPPVNGFLVSATTLRKPKIADVCDQANYLDSLSAPAVVIPRGSNDFSRRQAKVGDLAVVATAEAMRPVFAVVGDTGPVNKLGEASVALNGALLGKTGLPDNYNHVRGRGEYAGRGWGAPRSFVLIFPKSRDAKDPYMEPGRIEAESRKRFEAWGGLERLRACAALYP